jgi:hypothetical protein
MTGGDMRRIALTAIFVAVILSTCAVGSALASPEFFSEGEPVPAKTKIVFTWKGTASKIEMGEVMECNNSSAKGDIEGQNIVKLKITYEKCVMGEDSCQKTASKPGVIESNSLEGELVDASEVVSGPTSVAIELKAEKAAQPYMAYSCGPGESVRWTGSLLTEMGPVNHPESTTGVIITREKAAEEFGCSKQQLLYIEGAKPCIRLEDGAGAMWLVEDNTLTYKKPIEIRN